MTESRFNGGKSKELKISEKKKWQFDMRLLYTVCSMLVDETGAIRKREKKS